MAEAEHWRGSWGLAEQLSAVDKIRLIKSLSPQIEQQLKSCKFCLAKTVAVAMKRCGPFRRGYCSGTAGNMGRVGWANLWRRQRKSASGKETAWIIVDLSFVIHKSVVASR